MGASTVLIRAVEVITRFGLKCFQHICAKCTTVDKVSDSAQRIGLKHRKVREGKETIKNVPNSVFAESLAKF